LAALEIPAVDDIVPGYLTLAAYYDPALASYGEIANRVLAACEHATPDVPHGTPVREYRIPVSYDGPDLETVATATGLSSDDVVARHLARKYTVDLLGFVPGFAYMSELDPALHLPRRSQPRPRVAAASVAIAGSQTAVYPLDTPGGWHLIGHTGTVMFDAGRNPPALLNAGDTVVFERSK
jgi:KipI family sensor histidine kinase inhibitor